MMGPIGSGKTTILRKIIRLFGLQDYVYINRDYYFQKYYLNTYGNSKEIYDRTKSFFNYKLEQACDQGKDIILELVGKDNKIELINDMIAKSYNVTVLYVDVKELEICLNRIKIREEKSGYKIPIQLVEDRYITSRYYFRRLIPIVDHAYYIDNSADFNSTNHMLVVRTGVEEMYKLISVDCDGTLLNNEKKITEATIRSIQNAKSKGMKIVIASARPFYRLMKYLKILDLIDDTQYTIAFNGSLVVNNGTEKVIFSENLSTEEIHCLMDESKKYNPKVFLYTKTGIISNEDDEEYRRRNPDSNFEVKDFSTLDFDEIKIYKFVFVNTPENIGKVRTKILSDLDGKYEATSSVPQFIEVVKKGITKSRALTMIGKELDISCEEMIAFGDEDNDIPMMNYVGLSIAMGNATQKVKDTAKMVTATNDEDGVAKALDKLLTDPDPMIEQMADACIDDYADVDESDAEIIQKEMKHDHN